MRSLFRPRLTTVAANAREMEQSAAAFTTNKRTRRGFLDLLLGASALAWIASVAYPVIRYLKPLPQTGATGPTHLTRDEAAKLEANKFVIVPVSGQRVIVCQAEDQLLAFSAKCTHEGCTVTFRPAQSSIWCPCHDGRFDLTGRVVSGPPPQALAKFIAQRQPDGSIVVSAQNA
jgi:cytochrome b6-f complex iron-sulfur subunit